MATDLTELAKRAWDAFSDGNTTPELLEKTMTAQCDWEAFITSDETSVALGALLLWLRSNSKDYKQLHIQDVLKKVPTPLKETADWLTRHLTVGDPVSGYNDKQWRQMIRHDVTSKDLAQILDGRSSYELNEFHAGFLAEFDESSNQQHLAQLVTSWLRSPSTKEWASELLTYPSVAEQALQNDPLLTYYTLPAVRKVIAYNLRKNKVRPRVQAARGKWPATLDMARLQPEVRPSLVENADRWWAENPTYLDADDLARGRDYPIDLYDFAQELGIPVYIYHDEDSSWWGMVIWDDNYGRPAIVLREPQSKERRRFTFAHEIGHLWLNFVDIGIAEEETDVWNVREVEERANRFASTLLIPRQMVNTMRSRDMTTLKSMAESLGVSIQAMAVAVIEVWQTHAAILVRNDVIQWIWSGIQFPSLKVARGDILTDKYLSTGSLNGEQRDLWVHDASALRLEIKDFGDYRLFWMSA